MAFKDTFPAYMGFRQLKWASLALENIHNAEHGRISDSGQNLHRLTCPARRKRKELQD